MILFARLTLYRMSENADSQSQVIDLTFEEPIILFGMTLQDAVNLFPDEKPVPPPPTVKTVPDPDDGKMEEDDSGVRGGVEEILKRDHRWVRADYDPKGPEADVWETVLNDFAAFIKVDSHPAHVYYNELLFTDGYCRMWAKLSMGIIPKGIPPKGGFPNPARCLKLLEKRANEFILLANKFYPGSPLHNHYLDYLADLTESKLRKKQQREEKPRKSTKKAKK